uniref:Potassium two pore domain channel subfamily K member 4 n=1 Tax=Neogobius melanostomus TaxID=47308 RepID=A0A8C6UTZ4_9GOBI
MRCSTLLGILTGVLLYLLPREERKHMRLQDMRRYFLENFTCVGPENLQEFIEEVVEAIGAGVLATENTTFVSQWDLASAFFFSGTIITTIGFGNISPKTDGGQLFCIFYALVGIPMFGFLLAGVGGHLGTGLRKAVLKIEMIFLKFRVSPTIVRIISAILSILLGVGLFVAVPIGIFQEVEGWTLLESAYFVVITLTTVGFGDYVAGSDHWYKPLVWFWILLGLAYFASVLTMIGNWLRVLSKKTRAEMEALQAHASDWTQNIQNMSVDFKIPRNIDDPFRRRRRKRHHGGHRSHHRSHGNNVPGAGSQEGNEGGQGGRCSESESSYTSSSHTSDEDSQSGSESGSQATQTDRVPEPEPAESKPEPAHLSNLLDYFGENLAFIDESSDAQSGTLHLDPPTDPTKRDGVQPRQPKRRRHRRHLPNRSSRNNHTTTISETTEPNGNAKPISDPPPEP